MTEVVESVEELTEFVDGLSTSDRLEEMLHGAPTSTQVRPSREKLASDQAELLVRLLDGFDSRESVLLWMEEAVIQSLGRLDDEWYAETLADPVTMSALLSRPSGGVSAAGFSTAAAREGRRSLAADVVIPAFRDAHHKFRWSAGERLEWLDEEGDDEARRIDPELQQFPAMRPALGELEEKLEWSLDKLLSGFATADELLMWVSYAAQAAHAEVDEETLRGAYFERPVREQMLASSESATFFRQAWAAEYLLPAFNRATAAAAKRAGEVITGEDVPDQSPMEW